MVQKTNKPATTLEKDQIKDLLKAGNSVAEVAARFPNVDGRVISGTYRHMSQVGTAGIITPTPPPPPASAIQNSAGATAPAVAAPAGSRATALQEHVRTGFTPEARVINTAEGFKSDFREYYMVKKLDQPGEGIKGTEYPPFDLKDLAARYEPGEYQIQHYREGHLYQVYRDKIAPRGPSQAQPGPNGIRPEALRPVSAVDEALRLANVIHNAGSETRGHEAAARQVEATAKIEEVKGRVQVETSAQVALMQVVKDALAGKGEKDPFVSELMGILKSNQSDSKKSLESEIELMRARSKIEMEEMRERSKNDRELERERAKNEMDRFKLDLAEREKIQNSFTTKMAEIESERARLNEEWRDKMATEQSAMRESVTEELAERRRMNDEMIKIQRTSNDEYLKMRKEMGAGANDIKVAEIIERGITTSLDRIGARIDLLASNGVIGNKTQTATTKVEEVKKADFTVKDAAPEHKEEPKVFDEESLRAEFERPWFREWKTEVVATLKKRASGLPIDGSLMGQVFIDSLNEGKVKPMHIQWILSRTWKAREKEDPKGLLDYAAQSISDAEMKILDTQDGEKWYGEFIWFIAEIWNQNIARAKAERSATPSS